MTTIAIYAWSGQGNIGDQWLLESALAALPVQQVVHVTERTSEALKKGTDSGRAIQWPAPRVLDSARFHRAMREVDALLLAGGGWLAGDQGYRSPSRWAYRLSQVPVPIHALGLGLGPFPSAAAVSLGSISTRRLKTLSVRTAADASWARQLGRSDARVTNDLTFLKDVTREDAARPRRGVVISMPAPRSHWWQATPREYREAVHSLAAHLACGEPVSFVHFQHGHLGDSEFWEGVDRSGPTTIEDALTEIRGARVVLAGRLHAALAAARVGTPSVVFGYHHKFDLLGTLGLRPRHIKQLLLTPPERISPEVADEISIATEMRMVRSDFAREIATIVTAP
ncbi:MAG: polysaccharide pyruvyl transferase family protein [Actinomycetales bacterium]